MFTLRFTLPSPRPTENIHHHQNGLHRVWESHGYSAKTLPLLRIKPANTCNCWFCFQFSKNICLASIHRNARMLAEKWELSDLDAQHPWSSINLDLGCLFQKCESRGRGRFSAFPPAFVKINFSTQKCVLKYEVYFMVLGMRFSNYELRLWL